MKKILSPLLAICVIGTAARAQFVENKGQVLDLALQPRPEVRFYYGAPDAALYFLPDRVVYAFREQDPFDFTPYANNVHGRDSAQATLGYTQHRVDMLFVGADPNVEIVKGEKIPGNIHFYLDQRNGIRDVGSYKTVTYKNLYPHIDAVFYELPTGLKYDIVLHEGARIEDVKIAYDGAKKVQLEGDKVLVETSYKTLEEHIPLAYINGNKDMPVKVAYTVDEKGILSFAPPEQPYETLTIDPVLEWATYFNGTAAASGTLTYDQNHLDDQGNFYIHGIAANSANNFPTVNPGGSAYVAAYNAGYDVYLAKFNASRSLVWSSYLGGSGSEYTYGSNSMASRGNILHLVGEGMSAGAPFTNGGGFYQATADRNFWARFDLTTGQLLHLTTLGGGYKPSIAVSNGGLVAIIKDAYDFNTPVVMNRAGAYNQATNGGFKDMFLMMFNASYAQTWGTFLGGPGTQENFMCAFDNNENLFFVGENNWSGASSNAATEKLVNLPGAHYQGSIAGGTDVTLGKFNSAGALVWHTLYGGNNSDARQGQQGGYAKILLHPTTQELLLLFNTTSVNLITQSMPGAYYKTVPTHPSYGGASGSFWNYAAYLAKFSTAGALNYASYWYNTTDGDLIFDASFGGCDKLYIAGRVDYNTAVTQPLPAGFNLPNGQQTFVMQMNSNTYASEWTSFLSNNSSMQPSVSGLPNTPRVYLSANGYYDNGPTVNPGNGAYYQANNINQPPGNPTAFAYNYMLWQLHPSLPPDVTGDLDICQGETTTLTASGGTGAPYNWYTGSSGGGAFYTGSSYTTPGLSGNTTYYVSSGSGMCESPRTPVTVTVNLGGGTPHTVTGGGTFCSGGAGVPVGLNGSDAGVDYQLQVGGVNTGTPVTGNGSAISFGNQTAPGTYTVVTVGGGGGCGGSMTGSVTVTVITTPATPGFTVNSPACEGSAIQFNGPTLAATGYFWSGPNGFTSSLEDPQIAPATAAASGTYSLYVVSASCTSATATQSVTVNPVPAAPNFSTNSPVCSGNNINLTGPAISGATYVWSGPNGFASAVQSPSITGAAAAHAGTYSLYVVVGGCTSATATQNVVVNATPAISLGTTTSPGCGLNNGSAIINGSGSGSIGWTGTSLGGNPFATLPYTMSNLGAGTYNVGFISSQGCTSNVVVVNLTNPSAPATPDFTTNSPVCAGATLNLDGPAVTGATYVWSGPNGFTSSVENPSVTGIPAAGAGTYTLYVVVNNCTSATASQAVAVTPLPAVPDFTTNSPVCEGSTLNLNGPAVTGATYVWSGPNAFSSAVQNPSITGTTAAHAGTYSLNVVVNGCSSATATQNVVISPIPVIATGTVTDPTGCGSTDGSVQITGTGTGNLGWTGTATGAALGITLPHTITGLGSGSYSVAFVSAAGCTSNVVVANLANPPAPGTPSFSSNSPVCEGSSITLTATPVAGATYVWNGPNGFSAGTATPNVPSAPVSASGTYSLYVVVNGCTSATATQTLTVNPTPAIPVFTSNAPICTGSTLSLDATAVAGATYVWGGPNGFTSGVEDPSIAGATAAATGGYTLYVVVNGCTSATATQTLTVYDIPPAPVAGSNSPLCEGSTLSLTASTPVASSFSWSGPGGWTASTANPSIPGATAAQSGTYSVYAVVGTCTSATATVPVVITPKPILSYSGPVQTCGSEIAFAATETPTANTVEWFTPAPVGSGNPFNYSYPGTLPATVNGWVTGTNVAGCTDTAFFTVQFLPKPVAQFTAQDACDGESVQLQYSGSGTPVLAWTWPGGSASSTTATAHFGNPGTYTVTLVAGDVSNPQCTDTLSQTVSVLPELAPAFTYQSECLQEVLFSATYAPDSVPAEWHWEFGDGKTGSGFDTSHTYTASGTYSVIGSLVTANGCTFVQQQGIEVKLSQAAIPDDIPNIFTPNGDNVNQSVDFEALLAECGEYEAVFYNRWGYPVFTQKNGTAPFAGKSQTGTDLTDGVYFYVLRYGESEKNGHITLIR